MATIKSYTDIEQSRKLAEFLPIESADMYYQYVLPKSSKIKHNPEIGNPINALEWYNKGYVFSGKEPITLDEYCVPCWSLASLLSVLPKGTNISTPDPLNKIRYSCWNDYDIFYAGNPVDACVDMIKKLHELKLL